MKSIMWGQMLGDIVTTCSASWWTAAAAEPTVNSAFLPPGILFPIAHNFVQ